MRTVVLAIVCLTLIGCTDRIAPHRRELPNEPSVARLSPMTHQYSVPVLMYHRIAKLNPSEQRSPLMRDLTVDPQDFDRQVKFLKDHGYVFLHVSDLEAALQSGKPLPHRAVALTMDDGYKDNFTEALPILAKHNAKATVFMVTNNFDRVGRLSWEDSREMVRRDFSFQSHSVSHPDLTTLMPEQLEHELVESKRVLESGLGIRVTSVAYPAGAFNAAVGVACADAGYRAAWKKGGGPVRPLHASRPFELPRIRIHGRTDFEKFKRRVFWSEPKKAG